METPSREGGSPLARLYEWSRPYHGLYLLSVLLAVVGVAGSVLPYVAAGNMVVAVLQGRRELGLYVGWCAFAAASYGCYVLFHYASTSVSHLATFRTISAVRRLVATKLARVPMGYVLDTPSGTLKNILVEKADGIETVLAHAVPEMTSNLLVPVVVVAYLFSLDWRLALVSLATLPVGALALGQMMRDYESWYGRTVRTGNEMSSAAVEYVNGIQVIKAFGRSASSYEKFSTAARNHARSYIDWMAHCQVWSDLALAIMPATLVGVLPVGCMLVSAGQLAPETLVLAATLSLGIFPPLYAALSFFDSLAQVGTIVGQISGVLDEREQRRADDGAVLPALEDVPGIELSGVRFSYGDVEVLHGVDLSVMPGSVCALVGPSGSGKSTLARLMAGYWDPDAGTVSLGGRNLTSLSARQLADEVAYVSQECYLFNDSIMENIRMGRPDATDAEVMEAARLCGCHEFIMALDHGYQTVVGDAGGHLSGGERQRVAIVRAMLHDSPVIILDEATAYTDPESEAQVEAAVSRLIRGRTLVVIAHRLSTITTADRIVVVDGGLVRASGTHEELMEECALYRRMYLTHRGARDEAQEGE
ncbi:ABC transporter ATP-binding protein [Olsenella sp. HMSC062G07]|uniref:ABC transporter ATP-binding protein n=1 Tax=Olsenella sp. HMSC062G07 TaxID=1739330 RepID=UPI0008A19DAB|nr:ABC transporter ATP-binding protein [Olsenella sp. HMSC062G07]OFK24289.1 multidrug ABC transporter permease [Olsenella sp. HMSC062G07]